MARDVFYDEPSHTWFYCGAIDLATGTVLEFHTYAEATAVDRDLVRLLVPEVRAQIEAGRAAIFAGPEVDDDLILTADRDLIARAEQAYCAHPGEAHAITKRKGATSIRHDPVTAPLVAYDGRRWIGTSGSWGLYDSLGEHNDDTAVSVTLETHTLTEVVTIAEAESLGLTVRHRNPIECSFPGLLFTWQPDDGPAQELVLTDHHLTLVEPAGLIVKPKVRPPRAARRPAAHAIVAAPVKETTARSATTPVRELRQPVLFELD